MIVAGQLLNGWWSARVLGTSEEGHLPGFCVRLNAWTALHAACAHGHVESVTQLLAGASEAELNSPDPQGNTPLHLAARCPAPESLLASLLGCGASVRAANKRGDTPLHVACAVGSLDALRSLIAADAPVDAASTDGSTPLCIAARLSHLPSVHVLLQAGADPNRRTALGESPLMLALDVPPCAPYVDALVCALIGAGADVNLCDAQGHTPLGFAIDRVHTFAALELLENGADPNAPARGSPPLALAGGSNQWTVVEALIAAGADVNAKRARDGATPLHVAMDSLAEASARLLVSAGADVSEGDEAGTTPLYKCVSQLGSAPLLCLLVEAGADPNRPACDGATPLTRAVVDGSLDMVAALLSVGADPSVRDKAGRTAKDLCLARADTSSEARQATACMLVQLQTRKLS